VLVELWVGKYATSNAFVNGDDGNLKTSTTYCEKTIIWIMFENLKIGTLTKEKYSHYYDNNIKSKWTPMYIPINYHKKNLTCNNKNHPSFSRIITR
jgi:hypothetical protein